VVIKLQETEHIYEYERFKYLILSMKASDPVWIEQDELINKQVLRFDNQKNNNESDHR
jgi:hypothetical protein